MKTKKIPRSTRIASFTKDSSLAPFALQMPQTIFSRINYCFWSRCSIQCFGMCRYQYWFLPLFASSFTILSTERKLISKRPNKKKTSAFAIVELVNTTWKKSRIRSLWFAISASLMRIVRNAIYTMPEIYQCFQKALFYPRFFSAVRATMKKKFNRTAIFSLPSISPLLNGSSRVSLYTN